MINPKELRIGNYVFDKGWEAERPIGATDIYDMVIKSSENYDHIVLTPEWLEKLGFDKKIDADREEYWVCNYVELYWYEFHNLADNAFYHITNSPHETVIKYVHQAQNLYFALTNGKELELKNN